MAISATTPPRPYQVGLIGFGLAGSTFHAPVIAAVPGLQLAAVVSSQEKLVHSVCPQVRVHSEAQALLDDPEIDLVVIAAPNAVHFELAEKALLAGKHVVVDKPFTVHSSEALALIACAEKAQRVLSVYHNRRWDGDFMTLQALLKDGRLGRINSLESRIDRFRPQVRERWREQLVPGGGLLYDLGPHLIDQALCLFGMPQHIFADLALQRDKAQVVDYLHLVLYYTEGNAEKRVVLHAGSLTAAPTPRFSLHGDLGSFVKFGMDPQEESLRAGGRPGQALWGVSPRQGVLHLGEAPELSYPIVPGCYHHFYEGMVAAMAGKAKAPVNAMDAYHGIVLIEAALQSARERRVVDVVNVLA